MLRKTTAVVLTALLTQGLWSAVRGEAAAYVGGTITQIKQGTQGTLNLEDKRNLRFVHKRGTYELPYDQISTMEFGQKVGRRVGSTIALGVTTLGVMAIPMLLSKKKKHYLTIGFKEPDGSGGAIVLELSKSTVRTIIPTLEARTGKKVEQEEGEEGAARQAQTRGLAGSEPSGSDTAAQGKAATAATPAASAASLSIPPDTGVKPETPADARPTKLSSARSNSPVSPPAQASLNITSAPLSADIQLNGKFVGNTPSVLKVNPGSYKILVTKSGFKDWEREIVVGAGDSISLNPEWGAATFHAVPSAPPIPAASARPNPPSLAPASARAAAVLPSISLESTPSSAAVC